jgi:hypothetical protein
VSKETVLNLQRVHVLAAADNDVLDPPSDAHVPISIDAPLIASLFWSAPSVLM